MLTQVQDEGNGIKERNLKTLFSMFNNGMKANYSSGIGLGLTSALSLSLILQGGIHLKTRKGLGTVVGFSVLTKNNPIHIKPKELKLQ